MSNITREKVVTSDKLAKVFKARQAKDVDFSVLPSIRPGERSPLVTLIHAPALVYKWADAGPLTPPLGAAYIAASLLSAGYRAKIVDAIGENPSQVNELGHGLLSQGLQPDQIVELIDPETDVIGVSIMFSQDWLECRKIIQLIRKRFPRTPIVVGGEHVTALPEFLIRDCPEIDVCVRGEGEEAIIWVVDALVNGKDLAKVGGISYRLDGEPVSTAFGPRIRNVDAIPKPAWHLVPIENYLDRGLSYGVNLGRTMPLVATRGCPYQCTFCSSPFMWTTKYVMRDPKDVLDEMQSYIDRYQATNFDFYDLTMVVKRDWILDFARMIRERGMNFTWQLPSGTRSEALDDEVLQALYQTGCRNITYAPESGSPEELERIKKKVDLDRMAESMERAVRHGLNIKANIIFGFPQQKRGDVWKTIKFMIRMARIGVHDAGVSMFSPYPGSELFDELRDEKLIPEMNDRYFLSLAGYKDLSKAVSYTRHMGSREMALYRLAAMLIFYSIQFAVRPVRFFRLVRNFLTRQQSSRLDKSLQDMYSRIRNISTPDVVRRDYIDKAVES